MFRLQMENFETSVFKFIYITSFAEAAKHKLINNNTINNNNLFQNYFS